MKNFLLLSLLLLSMMVFSQERINETFEPFNAQTQKLTEAIRWEFDVVWESKSNSDFFISLQIKKITIESINYYVLLVERLNWDYRYPSIRKDRFYYKDLRGYIFDEENFFKIKNYKTGVSRYSELLLCLGNENCTDEIIERQVNNRIKEGVKRYYKNPFKVKLENPSTIRFILPLREDFATLDLFYSFEKQYFETDINNFNKLIIFN